MFLPKYTITNSILKNIGTIDAAKEMIVSSPINPGWEGKLRRQARERIICFGLQLDGNRLSEDSVKEVLDDRDVFGPEEDKQEASNTKDALNFIDQVVAQINPPRPYMLTLETILELHKIATQKLKNKGMPGQFRANQIIIRDTRTGSISYTPPPAAEAPFLIEDLLNWINSKTSQDTHPVIKSGIIQFELCRIHPFTFANSLIARSISLLVLYLDSYDIRKLYCLEEYYAGDPVKYHLTIQAVANQAVLDTHERDLTPWLEYFVEGFSKEILKIKELLLKVSTQSHLKGSLGEEVELNERQMIIIEYLQRHKEMRNKDFRKMFPDFSDDTVLRELKFLKQKGLVKKTGGTKKAVYVLGT